MEPEGHQKGPPPPATAAAPPSRGGGGDGGTEPPLPLRRLMNFLTPVIAQIMGSSPQSAEPFINQSCPRPQPGLSLSPARPPSASQNGDNRGQGWDRTRAAFPRIPGSSSFSCSSLPGLRFPRAQQDPSSPTAAPLGAGDGSRHKKLLGGAQSHP